MKVICFGDSNTYGYDPRPLDGGRYDASCRWVDILEAKTAVRFPTSRPPSHQTPTC